jgi:hypothetical protein
MKNKTYIRVVKLDKLNPAVNNRFPEAAKARKLYETGLAIAFSCSAFPSSFFQRLFGLVTPDVFYLIENGGIYSEQEVEFVTEREIELENVLFNLQSVFPNTDAADKMLSSVANFADGLVLDESLKEARKLLRPSALMQHRRGQNKDRQKMRRRSRRQELQLTGDNS